MAKKENEEKVSSKLDEILNVIKTTKEENVKLHFITRILKEGVKKRDKTLDKYIFSICNQLLLNILRVISQKYGHNL